MTHAMQCPKHHRPLDKQGYCSECVDTAVTKGATAVPVKAPTPKRGVCNKCGYSFNVLRTGVIATHHLYDGNARHTVPCAGSGHPPRIRVSLPPRPTHCRHADIGADMGRSTPVLNVFALRTDCADCTAMVHWLTERWHEAL